jgi:H+/Cl- antiporter ClcA
MRFVRQIARWQDVIRVMLITLVIGWFAALLFGLWIARLQYDEVSATLPPNQVSTEYELRIDRELKHGLLLFLPQVGVMAAILAWQVAYRATGSNNPQLFGALTGTLLASIQSIIALVLQIPWIYIIMLWLLFIGTGTITGWMAEEG